MIQPIRNIFSNWRNPQHKPIEYITYNIGKESPVLVYYSSNMPVIIRYKEDGVEKEKEYEARTMGLVYFYDPSVLVEVESISVRADAVTPYLAYIYSYSDWVILRDER